ncbi:PREDICTED: uncharacterized protein LOC109153771 [Ipomoea nil]|uniref:uncharacterized protein LOC109153771 n=1 Tax=Ipomoea nil TaxID=35883 RepID=UPI00090088A4|nr:PREDICTED: uncharacterized protein LOC109153771 [Ipomoea nil]
MQAHLSAIHDEMWGVIENGPIMITMVNTQAAAQGADPTVLIPKPKSQLTSEEKTRANLNNVVRDILYKCLDDSLFPRVRKCKTTKQIWDTLMDLGEGDEQEKDNKLTMAMKRFEDFKILPNEIIGEMEFRFTNLLVDISDLGKEPTQKEINLKILRGLPKAWDMKLTAMRDHRDLKSIQTTKIFSDLKAYEFENEPKEIEEPETINIALADSKQTSTSNRSNSNPSEFLSDEQFSLFVRTFKRFIRKNKFQKLQTFPSSSNRRQAERSSYPKKTETEEAQVLCYNCRKPGHFKANCPHPIVRKYHDKEPITSSPIERKDAPESKRGNNRQESNLSRHERRRIAMVVNESNEVVEPEESTSSSISDIESSEAEKVLLCLFSREENENHICLMANHDEVNSQPSFSTQIESSSESEESSNESVNKMIRDFEVVKNTYSKLKEENSRLMISYDELRSVRIKNIELAITNDQLEKQVLLLKEQCTERELREQNLREVIALFTNSSKMIDRMVNASRLLREKARIGYSRSSPSQILLNKPTDPSSNGVKNLCLFKDQLRCPSQ